jgi:pimeloyl-ACP methyl ester carboxylesterase
VKFLALPLICAAAWAAPCTEVADCVQWVTLGGGPARGMVYSTYPLNAANPAIVRALVVLHGSGRDADNYFRTAMAGAFLAGALEDTVVVAPRMASNTGPCHDTLAADEVAWSCTGDSWRSGGDATNREKLTSFDFADELLRRLADKKVFPNLRLIVMAGHSAGGQFVDRYAMANRVHETLGVPLKYVVSNPSSYAYLDNMRPSPDGMEFHALGEGKACPAANQWPYGLERRVTGYTAKLSDEQLRKQLAERPVLYLMGEIDILPLGGFDSSCGAMAQGANRRARGEAFARYVNLKYGAHHTLMMVSLCGHNARCMFTAESALPVLFPK